MVCKNDIEAIFNQIERIDDLIGFGRYLYNNNNKQHFDDETRNMLTNHKPPAIAPHSPEQARLLRHKAIGIKQGWHKNTPAHREWQNYWLACCRSSKCDFIFKVLSQYGIDREQDMQTIMTDPDFLPPEQSVRDAYEDVCTSFLLRRYSLTRAWKLKGSSWPTLVKFLLPRLLGAMIAGMIYMTGGQTLLERPSRLYENSIHCFVILAVVTLLMGFLFLLYSCQKVTGYGFRKVVWRAFLMTGIGLLYSAIITAFVLIVIIYPESRNTDSTGLPKLITWLTTTEAAFLLGILLQAFWEEKTVSEPL